MPCQDTMLGKEVLKSQYGTSSYGDSYIYYMKWIGKLLLVWICHKYLHVFLCVFFPRQSFLSLKVDFWMSSVSFLSCCAWNGKWFPFCLLTVWFRADFLILSLTAAFNLKKTLILLTWSHFSVTLSSSHLFIHLSANSPSGL